MKIVGRIKAKQGFRPSFPGYTALADIKCHLVGNTVVIPPGPNMNGVEALGLKSAPWLAVPLSAGTFEWVACEEDPTAALQGHPAPLRAGDIPNLKPAKAPKEA